MPAFNIWYKNQHLNRIKILEIKNLKSKVKSKKVKNHLNQLRSVQVGVKPSSATNPRRSCEMLTLHHYAIDL